MPATPPHLEPLSMEQFKDLVEKAGLHDVPPEDLELMKNYWDGARPQIAMLRQALALPDEPATVFSAAPPRLFG
jgi:hypothetical protein